MAKTKSTPSATQIAYAAGYFDGEGSVSIRVEQRKTGQRCHTLMLTIGSTDCRPLNWIVETFGGAMRGPLTVNRKPHHKPIYHWQMGAAQAGWFLQLMRPFLITKKPQAEIALRLRSLIVRQGKRLSIEALEQRDELKAALRVLNRRGLAPEQLPPSQLQSECEPGDRTTRVHIKTQNVTR